MSWVADFHIHSHFSMATSKEGNPVNLCRWAGLKGVSLAGTGDFTHPGWRNELKEELIPAEPGFYRLKNFTGPEIPDQPEVRFIVSGELSTIYKKQDRVRKVHHLILLPSLEDADRISNRIEGLGMNIRSDGRPILGLDSYRLLELVLESCPEAIFIPAHIWTPHFSVFGSNSGFDEINDCYEDLTPYIPALETGLSSDPVMNWRWSALDRFTLVSNSDAHNPQNLAREANLFEGEFSYPGVRSALQNKNSGGFAGTLEFFPEEGKYHYDGHRNCEVCWTPEETRQGSGLCPICGRKVTVGVLHRVAELADRAEGFRPEGAKPFQSLVPLREVIASSINLGVGSRRVEEIYFRLLQQFGPELTVLRETAVSEIARKGGPLLAEGIRRLRAGEVETRPGYDGEYGVISVLREDDRLALQGQAALFETESKLGSWRKNTSLREVTAEAVRKAGNLIPDKSSTVVHSGLSSEQQEAINSQQGTVIVIAGPGTGKTRTLVERIAALIRNGGNPSEITGVTFTNKAAAEMKIRVGNMLAGDKRVNKINLGTFHSLSWKLLNLNPDGVFRLLDEIEAREIVEEILRQNRIPMTAREASLMISLIKNKFLWEEDFVIPEPVQELYRAYQECLEVYHRWDFDDVILKAAALWEENPVWLEPLKKQFIHLLVDEFQDLNLLQYKLVKLWAKESQSLLVIGDPNQSIYGFRGASSQFFDEMIRDFPDAAPLRLSRNYRSSAVVIKASNAFVDPIYHQTSQDDQNAGQKITWLETPSEKSAGKAVVNEIINLLGGSTMISAHGGRKGGRRNQRGPEGVYGLDDFAILYRTGKQAEALELALTVEGLPYRVVGQTVTLEASPVKEFLAFFRYLVNPEDLFLLRSTLKFPSWGLSPTEISDLVQLYTKKPADALEEYPDYLLSAGLAPELINKVRQFQGVAGYYRSQLERSNREIVEDWILRMGLMEVEELEHLKRISENYKNIKEFLNFLPLSQEADLWRKGHKTTGTEAITLSTIHASKGLEFPVVFVVGVEEGLLPLGTEPSPETVAEEQRLFYVSLTRAKEVLYLVNSQYRFRYGENNAVEVSRFLKMIPGDLVEKVEWHKQNQKVKQLELF